MNQTSSPSDAERRVTVPNDTLFGEVARLLAAGRAVTIPTKGSSMFPFIVGGRDRVVLRAPGALRVGDIALARSGRGWVLHRVVAVRPDRVTLMGDANLSLRETCRPADVCGVATAIVRPDRTVDCAARGVRCRAAVWRRLLPLRRGLLFVLRRWYRWKGGAACA